MQCLGTGRCFDYWMVRCGGDGGVARSIHNNPLTMTWTNVAAFRRSLHQILRPDRLVPRICIIALSTNTLIANPQIQQHPHTATATYKTTMPEAGLQQPLLNGNGDKKGGGAPAPHVAIGVAAGGGGARPSQQTAEGVVPIVLETRGLNYYLGADKGQEKHILKDVSLRFSSGVLTAVMG